MSRNWMAWLLQLVYRLIADSLRTSSSSAKTIIFDNVLKTWISRKTKNSWCDGDGDELRLIRHRLRRIVGLDAGPKWNLLFQNLENNDWWAQQITALYQSIFHSFTCTMKLSNTFKNGTKPWQPSKRNGCRGWNTQQTLLKFWKGQEASWWPTKYFPRCLYNLIVTN